MTFLNNIETEPVCALWVIKKTTLTYFKECQHSTGSSLYNLVGQFGWFFIISHMIWVFDSIFSWHTQKGMFQQLKIESNTQIVWEITKEIIKVLLLGWPIYVWRTLYIYGIEFLHYWFPLLSSHAPHLVNIVFRWPLNVIFENLQCNTATATACMLK